METTQDEKVLLTENTEESAKIEAAAQEALNALNPLISAFTHIIPVQLNSVDAVAELATQSEQDIEVSIRLLIYDQNRELQALPIPKAQAIFLQNLPAGYADFIYAARDYRKYLGRVRDRYVYKTPLEYFTVENNEVVLNEKFYHHLDARTKRFATDEEAQLLREVEQIRDRLNALEERFPDINMLESPKDPYNIKSILFRSSRTGKILINNYAINL